ncbi:sialic acid-binding Ig-like lectin 6 [Scleropages formosus]|uniref:sialic acid-binding Ig-like lectin 6 n=1 Tax=Scleropages formosus TaxID=113540 RepID=UPI0010FA9A59|nr:sialic acid-binding Ig-like lectin 6 [Scleropages formosus]
MFFFFFFCLVVNTLQTSSTDWTADYPSSISTIQDVCVVIPCTYKYPDTKPNTEKTWTGYWYINENDKQAVYDEKIANVLSNFKNRTRLVGNLSQGNCSLMINDVKKADHQKMYFRIQIKNLDNYSFLKKTVSITVQDAPLLTLTNNVMAGTVSASCSVPYNCPPDHLKFVWNRNGTVIDTYEGTPGQRNLTSHLSFSPTLSEPKTPVTCTVISSSGKKIAEASQEVTKALVRAIEVPKTMSALGGSCLVIPCKFLCPDLSNPINTSAGFWLASSTTDFVYHTDSSKVAEQYKGRTQLIGDLKKGNCSLKIDHLQYNDNGPFYFRIEMTNYNFSFIEYKVSIAILGKRYTVNMNIV